MTEKFFFDDFEFYQMQAKLARRMIPIYARQLHLTSEQKRRVNMMAAGAAASAALYQLAESALALQPALMAMKAGMERMEEEARRAWRNFGEDITWQHTGGIRGTEINYVLMDDEEMTAEELRKQDLIDGIWDRIYYNHDHGRFVSEAIWFFMVRLSWLLHHLPVWLFKDRKLARARGWMVARARIGVS